MRVKMPGIIKMPFKATNRIFNPWNLERRIKRKEKFVERVDAERAEAEKRLDVARNTKRNLFEERPGWNPMHRILWGESLVLAENAMEREGRLFGLAKKKLRKARAGLATLQRKSRK